MDYYEIGQRIRKQRKACGLSQEELAEKVDISVTHMSHIETGNTKLSLPALVRIAGVLEVRVDDLLFERLSVDGSGAYDEIVRVLSECSDAQAELIAEIVKSIKMTLDKQGQ